MRYSSLHWLLIAALSDCYNVRPFTLLSQHLLFLLNVRRGWWEKHIPEDTIFFGFDEKAVGLVIGYLIYIHFQCCFLRCLLPHPGVDALGRMTFTKAAAGSGRGDSPQWHSLAWLQQGQAGTLLATARNASIKHHDLNATNLQPQPTSHKP